MDPEALARQVIRTLRASGHQAYLVGGCVRDLLLGAKPKDFDIATDARPDRIMDLFPKSGRVGAHFGVVLVREERGWRTREPAFPEQAVVREQHGLINADFVREATGFAIGGVPPVGHVRPPIVLIDETLLRFDNIWAAAGTPNAVFRLTPADLVALTGGLVVDVANG
jgi:hypothetical protein